MTRRMAARHLRDETRGGGWDAARRSGEAARGAGSRPAEAGLPISPLTEAALLGDLSARERRRIARLFEDRRYAGGSAVFVKGDPADFVCFVKSGLVKLVTESHGRRATLLHILKPGDVFGELLLAEESRPFTAVAATDATVDAISRANFLRLLATRPAVSLSFIRVLSRRLVAVERAVADFGHTWSYHRLAKVLLRLANDHGLPADAGTRIPLALTHAELANMIGTTRETVTTQLIRFKRLGLLAREGRHFVVDRRRLAEFIRAEELRFHGFPSPDEV